MSRNNEQTSSISDSYPPAKRFKLADTAIGIAHPSDSFGLLDSRDLKDSRDPRDFKNSNDSNDSFNTKTSHVLGTLNNSSSSNSSSTTSNDSKSFNNTEHRQTSTVQNPITQDSTILVPKLEELKQRVEKSAFTDHDSDSDDFSEASFDFTNSPNYPGHKMGGNNSHTNRTKTRDNGSDDDNNDGSEEEGGGDSDNGNTSNGENSSEDESFSSSFRAADGSKNKNKSHSSKTSSNTTKGLIKLNDETNKNGNKSHSQSDDPNSDSDYSSDDYLSIPAILDSMTQYRKEALNKKNNGNEEDNDEDVHMQDDDEEDHNDEEEEEEEEEDEDERDDFGGYFSGISPIDMTHEDLLLYMEKKLNNGVPASPDLPRVRVSQKKTREIKMHLWMGGAANFIRSYIFSPFSKASGEEVLAALSFPLPEAFVKQSSLDEINSLVLKAVQFTTMPRRRLPEEHTIDKLVDIIEKSKNIIVLTGAGISTSLGIPDFRSQSGLYTKLASLGLSDPQEVFDLNIFRQDPSIFYSIAKEILPVTTKFSPTHLFIKILQNKGKLLRNYTQNIDNLEHYAGILPEKLVQCHGSFATATCQTCGYKTIGENLFQDIRNQVVSRCPVCKKKAAHFMKHNKPAPPKKKPAKQKNSWDGGVSDSDDNDDVGYLGLTADGLSLHKKLYPILSPNNESTLKMDPIPSSTSAWTRDSDLQATASMVSNPHFGVMKPDITFFGEPLPNLFEETLINADDQKCDLLLCIGTSLKVSPVSETVRILPRNVVQVYISKTMISHNEFDVTLLGACDDAVEHLCHRLNWKMKHPMAKNRDYEPYIEYLREIATYEFHSEPIKKSDSVDDFKNGKQTVSEKQSEKSKSKSNNDRSKEVSRDRSKEFPKDRSKETPREPSRSEKPRESLRDKSRESSRDKHKEFSRSDKPKEFSREASSKEKLKDPFRDAFRSPSVRDNKPRETSKDKQNDKQNNKPNDKLNNKPLNDKVNDKFKEKLNDRLKDKPREKPKEKRQTITDKIFGKNMPKNAAATKNKQPSLDFYFSK